MNDWTSGYRAEIDYTHGFYRALAPAMLNFVALAKYRRAPELSEHGHDGKGLAYCELGCGQGFTANLMASANPDIDFHANDFAPAQIANARRMAKAGGVSNIRFSDAAFEEYVDDPALPEFDFIVLHGIYSWVSEETRKAVLEFLRRKLKVGGLVYLSFNNLPGWAGGEPMRRLMVEHAGTTGGPMMSRIEKALMFAERMREANAAYFRDTHGAAIRLKNAAAQDRAYLAHEFFNRSWRPFYFADVAAELDKAKLSYVGSAHLIDHVDAINLTPQHLAMLNETADPVFKETLRDYATLNQFRRDVFGRGALQLSNGEANAGWLDLRLALSVPADGFDYAVAGALGRVMLQEAVYKPLVEGLAEGPRTLRELGADPAVQALGWPRIMEAVKVMIGTGQAEPCLDPEGLAERAKRTRVFNTAVMRRAAVSASLEALASPVTGGGVNLNRYSQLFVLALQEKASDPPAHVWGLLKAENHAMIRGSQMLLTDEENLAELRLRYETFEKSVPMYRQLGIM